jgi:hypothetical protein
LRLYEFLLRAVCYFPWRESSSLLVQDNTQEGIVDVDLAVVFDEAQFPEFVHEKIDLWA